MSRGQLKAMQFLELVSKEFAVNYADFDTDNDGHISYDEFESALKSLKGMPALKSHQLRDIFSVIDTDGDGLLSIEELKSCGKNGDKSGVLARTLSPGQQKAVSFLELIQKQFKLNFEAYDTDGSGFIDASEFKAALASLDLELQPHQLRDVFSLIDADGDGQLSISEINNYGKGAEKETNSALLKQMSTRAPPRARPARTLTQGEEKAKQFLELVHSEFQPNFAKYDANNSGNIDKDEFAAALADMSLRLQPHQVRDLFSLIDADGDGVLDLAEIAMIGNGGTPAAAPAAAAPSNPNRRLTTGEKQAKQFLQLVHKEFSPNFAKFDTDGSGSIDRDEFKAALATMGLQLRSHQLRDLFSLIDENGDGSLSVAELNGIGAPKATRPATRPDSVTLEVRPDAAPVRATRISLASPVGTPGLAAGQCKALQFIELLYTSGEKPDFKSFDKDGDGFVTPEEFQIGLARLNYTLKPHQIADVFSIMDSDGDGRISYTEFETLGVTYREVHALHKEAEKLKNTKHWDGAMP